MSQAGSYEVGGGGGGGIINTIAGDIGSITGANVTIYAHNSTLQAGSTILFNNSGTISTLVVTDANANTIFGKSAGNLTTTTQNSAGFGFGVMAGLTSGINTTAFGSLVLSSLMSGDYNSCFGTGAGGGIVTGEKNTCLGSNAGANLLTDSSNNILIGYNSGSAYTSITGNESNICIGNLGIGTDNVLCIGTTGTGVGQQSTAYIAGIVGNTVSNAEFVTIDTTTGQLGTTTSTSSAFGFTAYASANLSDVTGGGVAYTILFDATTRNDGSSYNPATGLFTAPTTGLYMFTTTINQQSGSSYTAGSFFLFSAKGSAAGPILTTLDNNIAIASGLINFSSSFALQMTAGDTVGIEILNTTALQDVSIMGSTFSGGSQEQISMFSGFRIG